MIKPEFLDLYNWELSMKENGVLIQISIPECVDSELLNLDLSHDNCCILLSYSNEIPIIEGTLFKQVRGAEVTLNENRFEILLICENNEEWPVLCKESHLISKKMDPLSNFMMFFMLTRTNEESHLPEAFLFLDESCKMGYPPALISSYSIYSTKRESYELAMGYLSIAADVYSNPLACIKMGILALSSPESMNVEKAKGYFEKANTIPMAKSFLGIIYSPLSVVPYPNKDPVLAAQLFTEAINANPKDHVALHELAMLHYNGVGVPLDENLANEYQSIAISSDEQLPGLTKIEYRKPEKSIIKTVLTVASITAIAGVAYLVWKKKSRK